MLNLLHYASSAPTTSGPRTQIVQILAQYRRLPIPVIASLTGHSVSDVEAYVAPLVTEGLIRRDADVLSLTEAGRATL